MSSPSGREPRRREDGGAPAASEPNGSEPEGRDPAFGRIVRLAAVVAGARVAALALVDDEGARALASVGAPAASEADVEAWAGAVAERVARGDGTPIVVADASSDPDLALEPVANMGGGLVAVPVEDASGARIGSLLVAGLRAAPEPDGTLLAALTDLAGLVVDALESGGRRRALAAARAEIQRIAVVDPLTGLPNRRGFDERLDGAVALGRRTRLTAAVLMIGVDGLGEVRDRAGPGAVDAAVVELAERLSVAVREHDLVARAGPDAFVVLLQAIDRAAVAEAAGRLHEALTGEVGGGDDQRIRLRVSIGVALHPGDGEDVASLLRAADVARHEADAAGGGVRRFAPTPGTRT